MKVGLREFPGENTLPLPLYFSLIHAFTPWFLLFSLPEILADLSRGAEATVGGGSTRRLEPASEYLVKNSDGVIPCRK